MSLITICIRSGQWLHMNGTKTTFFLTSHVHNTLHNKHSLYRVSAIATFNDLKCLFNLVYTILPIEHTLVLSTTILTKAFGQLVSILVHGSTMRKYQNTYCTP